MTHPKTSKTAPPGANTGSKRPEFVDNAGHMDPEHARRLRALSAGNNARGPTRAFVSRANLGEGLAESLGEHTVLSMTTGDQEPASQSPEQEFQENFIELEPSRDFDGEPEPDTDSLPEPDSDSPPDTDSLPESNAPPSELIPA